MRAAHTSACAKVVVSEGSVATRFGAELDPPARIEHAISDLDIGPSSGVVLPERTAGGDIEKTMQNLGRVL